MNILFEQILENKEAAALPGLLESGGLPALVSGLSAVHRANLGVALRSRLGAPLFVKHTRAVKLTPYGQDFYRYVDLALQNLDTGISLVEQRAGLRRTTVRIGAIYAVQDLNWAKTLKAFRDSEKQATTFPTR